MTSYAAEQKGSRPRTHLSGPGHYSPPLKARGGHIYGLATSPARDTLLAQVLSGVVLQLPCLVICLSQGMPYERTENIYSSSANKNSTIGMTVDWLDNYANAAIFTLLKRR